MRNKIQQGIEQVTTIGKKVATDTKENVQNLLEKIQDENTKALLKKYNPVFPSEFFSENFSYPNMIVIVDDAVRKNIAVCKGSIGWKSFVKDIEVLHLYDEAIKDSGLQFVPVPSCDSIYYVDGFDRKKYIKLDNYFENAQNSKLAELEHIAFSLGAKSYTVELEESSTKERIATKKVFEKVELPVGTSKKKAESSADNSSESKETISKKVLKKATFTNGAVPVQPELKWFKYDDEMTNLIKMRLSGQINDNSMRDYSISLEGSAYSSIGASTAAKIDAAVSKLESGAGYNISNQEKQENKKKLVFKIQF